MTKKEGNGGGAPMAPRLWGAWRLPFVTWVVAAFVASFTLGLAPARAAERRPKDRPADGAMARIDTRTGAEGQSAQAAPTFRAAQTGQPQVRLQPTRLDFGGQPVFTFSDPQVIVLTNTGDAPLVVNNVYFESADEIQDFVGLTDCIGEPSDPNSDVPVPRTLQPGDDCGMVVAFAPETRDSRFENLAVESNAPGSPHRAPLTGFGTLGYWLVASDGGIFSFGDADFFGSTGHLRLNRPVVGMASTVSADGYWLVASDGGIFAFGEAPFLGSMGHVRLNQPIVGMAATPTGDGYWLVASDGGIFAFGDAGFYGSTGHLRLNRPIVGMAPTPTGEGYWLVASDGGIFAFGDADFFDSTGGMRLNRPIVGMAADPLGEGYWLVASDGGIFAFGEAPFFGSTGHLRLNRPIVGMAADPSGEGYWLVASDGGIFAFGEAPFFGSTGHLRLNQPIVGMGPTGIPQF